MPTHIEPETFILAQGRNAPNSDRPVLIYRDCLPLPLSESTAKAFLESHAWRHGGTWGHISKRHFHPNTHECYGIFQGESTLLLGCVNGDEESDGLKVDVRLGDVIVLPAGTAHCNLESSKDLRYVGVYPEHAPKWRNEYGENQDVDSLRIEAQSVPVPSQDPVNGVGGPLVRLWSQL